MINAHDLAAIMQILEPHKHTVNHREPKRPARRTGDPSRSSATDEITVITAGAYFAARHGAQPSDEVLIPRSDSFDDDRRSC